MMLERSLMGRICPRNFSLISLMNLRIVLGITETFLGDAQWEWLENELMGPQTKLTVIVSSVQVISNISATGRSPLVFIECWGHFPEEKERLFKLINDNKFQEHRWDFGRAQMLIVIARV